MQSWQQILLLLLLLTNGILYFIAHNECKNKKNAYGQINKLFFLGMFVWGDVLIFSLFWFLVAGISLILQSFDLFLLIVSVFWVVRSLGETIYWFLQQFTEKVSDANKPENLLFHSVLHNNSVWFIYQIMWQCICVTAIIFTIYFAKSFLD
jgi:hypothetical protein